MKQMIRFLNNIFFHFIAIFSKKIGNDDRGNVFYEKKYNKKRFVIYCDNRDPALLLPHWQLWLHNSIDNSTVINLNNKDCSEQNKKIVYTNKSAQNKKIYKSWSP